MSNDPKELWSNGDSRVAGEILWLRVPRGIGPLWAANILETARSRLEGSSPAAILECESMARNRGSWGSGHRAFSTIRKLVLALDDSGRMSGLSMAEVRLSWILAIAELVAKVAYNETDPVDPFDEDSGSWLTPCLRGLVDHESDPAFEAAAWAALSRIPTALDFR